ncbi:MAG: FimV/HubP family polar landmark protein [Gammaproteobacteria bacterium]|nr:FimV/HubP family polar landmark protein [Gammaproteobacteria bacterium]
MITRTRTFTSFAVLAALGVFLPMSNSHAFGLGKIELSSALNQPFKAQIPVTALREDEKGNLQVQLASASEFERAGLERSFYLTQFEFIVVENNGTTSIDIRSKDAVKEPFIDLLLTATAGNGRLIREYTVLLDPPKDIFVKKQTKIQTVASKPTQTATPISSKSTKYSAGSSYGPTDRSDTLWKIALKVKQDDATVHQMMMALLDENPEAFSNNNINGLKAGYNLDIPAETSIKKRSKSEAISAVAQQNTAWKNRNAKPIVTTTVEVTTSPTESPAVQAATEQVTMPVKNDELVESATDTTARLKLVAPSEEVVSNESEISPMGDDKLTALTEQLTLAQETIETQTQENIDIKSRMAAMEEQIETLRRLLSLKDPDLALLQSTLEQQTEVAESQDETVQTDATDSSTSNDMLDTQVAADSNALENNQAIVEDGLSPVDSDTQEQISDEISQTEALTNDAESVSTQAQESEQANTLIEQALNSVDGAMSYVSDLAGLDEEQIKSKYEQVKSYVTEHKQNSILGSLVLLLLIWLVIWMRNRRYVTWDQAVGDEPTKASTTTATHRPQIVDNEDVIDTEVAPVAADEPEKTIEQLVSDADVYVSYDDFAKAKQTLQFAHDAEPKNEEVIHKLLFVLFKQSQINEFVDLAEYYQNETNAAEWDEVFTWGQELAPQQALFQPVLKKTVEEILPEVPISQVVDTIELDEKNPDLDISSSNADIDDELMAFDFNQNSSDNEVALDINDELGISNVSQDDDRLSLTEVESLQLDRVDTIETDLDTTSNASTSDTMEFELDLNNDDETFELDNLEVVTDDDLTEANAALSGTELDFDLGDFDQVDEAETKLDLAAAYIDMGDPDGARSILEEVLLEGNDDQKTRAETMLSDIK